ncbi:3-oxoacyl-ACP reductase [Lentzea sp. NBRC 105346]|uniref:SDR family NAD(P)-dependent oxidoreductase n=1 Tax=Lentzea sp. NBRC 105346 TaxID=3032205 RepID=UPI0024A10663|nr:SDR family oxidoreductase [Lentzea sp. NBRC 105346]GLZ34627.1 3-oxoacyl-ACP reductase [Lentzea sp. NBRC 105346]
MTTAVVTGGGSGIGAAVSRRLAKDGHSVVVADLNGDNAERIADEIGGVAITLDVTDTDAVYEALRHREVDILVNNAGNSHFQFFVDTTPADWDFILKVNLVGAMACTHVVLKGMQQRRSGVIVNVSSEAGRGGTVAGAPYSAAKAGLLGFTKAIAMEAARYNVRCNAVAPGPVDTPMLHGEAAHAGELGKRLAQAMIDSTVLKRAGSPDEIAGAIAFLASEDASFITGHTLAVSGGLSML